MADYGLTDLAADMVGLLDAMHIERAIFVGHDWGRLVAWAMPGLYPQRTAGVIGVCTPYMAMPQTEAMRPLAYVTAAAKISRLAVGDPTISADINTYGAPRGVAQSERREGQPFGTRGGLLVQHVFPLDAEYEFRIGRAGGGGNGASPSANREGRAGKVESDGAASPLRASRLAVMDANFAELT